MVFTYNEISTMMDHALLSPTLTSEDLEAGCQMAVDYQVASVCILPYYLKRCAEILRFSSVKPSTTIGFPHGGSTISTKCAEAQQAIVDGCQELDMVVNVSQVLSGDWNYVRRDIQAVVDVAHGVGQKVKVIFETCYLNRDQKLKLCEICSLLHVDWVKTSTGFGPSGAMFDDLELMIANTPDRVQVKAAGGVKTLDTVCEMRALGVTRVGSSRTADILNECRQRLMTKDG